MKILTLVLIWIVILGLIFIAPRFTDPTHGLNQLPTIFGLFCLAFLVAVFTAVFGYRSRAEIGKWLLLIGFIPLAVDLLLIILLVAPLWGCFVGTECT
jgi:hypothetical protein